MTVLLTMCKKEYSYEGGPPAVFSIEGSPLVCSPIAVMGSYLTGHPLDTSNYAIVTADVSDTGTYNIYTNNPDGIQFSAFGKFTETGKQNIHLKAIGTPADAGNLNFVIPGTNGCNFDLVVKDKGPASYFLSGSPTDCSKPVVQGELIKKTKPTDRDYVVVNVNVFSPGPYKIKTNSVADISYAASGYFSKSGPQTVTLPCTGTPSESGLFYFNVFADSSQCRFSVPVSPEFQQAIYVEEYDQDTICLQYAINGNYTPGVPMNNSNTISFKVYATDVGNYTIYTKESNGIIFGTTGTFTQKGEQTVVLTGSGTPLSSGDFIFTPMIIGPSPRGGDFCHLSLHVQ